MFLVAVQVHKGTVLVFIDGSDLEVPNHLGNAGILQNFISAIIKQGALSSWVKSGV